MSAKRTQSSKLSRKQPKRKTKKPTSFTIKKGYLFLAGILALGLTIGYMTYGTYASFRSSEQEENNFRVDDYKVTITENFTPPDTLKPDTPVKKEVTITNNQSRAIFVRAMVLPVITSSVNGETLLLPAEYTGSAPQVTIDFNTTDWIDGKDGFFYYVKAVGTGANTSDLFTSVTLSSSALDDRYEDANVVVEVKAEGINTTAYSYRDAWWNGTIPASGDAWYVIDQALQGLVIQ